MRVVEKERTFVHSIIKVSQTERASVNYPLEPHREIIEDWQVCCLRSLVDARYRHRNCSAWPILSKGERGVLAVSRPSALEREDEFAAGRSALIPATSLRCGIPTHQPFAKVTKERLPVARLRHERASTPRP